MSRDDFKRLLKLADLNKKTLSGLLNTSYNTVNAWGTNGREYPYWLESWLNNYIKAKHYEDIKNKIDEIESRK